MGAKMTDENEFAKIQKCPKKVQKWHKTNFLKSKRFWKWYEESKKIHKMNLPSFKNVRKSFGSSKFWHTKKCHKNLLDSQNSEIRKNVRKSFGSSKFWDTKKCHKNFWHFATLISPEFADIFKAFFYFR